MDNDHDPVPPNGPSRVRLGMRRDECAVSGAAPPYRGNQPLPPVQESAATAPVFDSSGVSIERLRSENVHACYNAHYLLAPEAFFLLGFDSSILQVNLAGAEQFGIRRARCHHYRFRSFVTHPFEPDFDAFFQKALNSPAQVTCRVRVRRPGYGEAFHVTLRASADGSGQACRLLVEPAEGTQAALARSEERLRRIVHHADEGILEIDTTGSICFANPRMADMLGCGIEDLLGQALSGFLDSEGRALLEAGIALRQQGNGERQEFKFVGKDGHDVWATLATSPIVDAGGAYAGALILVSDVSGQARSNTQVWRQANFDALTNLPNRHMFMERLRIETRKADRTATFLALLFIDLDDFKDANNRLGHEKGDLLLIEVSRRIGTCVRGTDTLARIGGDEFGVILAGLDHVGSVERIVQQMLGQLALPVDLGGEKAFTSASIGIALYPPDASEIDLLVERAGMATHAARQAGGQGFSYVTPDQQEAALWRQHIAGDLRAAIAARQFEIVYQPIISLRTGQVHKAEALLRWRHPTRGLLGPAEFIPFAESSGLIVEIGDWVFREVAQQTQRWQESIHPQFQVSVNKSPVQFRHDAALYKTWLDYLNQLGLPPQSIVVEITERALLDGAEQVLERIGQYRAMGLQVALDDFGTGYSSLSHLKRYAIDYVKIDQSFVQTLEHDEGDLALCEAIILMAHKLGLKVVAEGVETKVQRALLVDAGCDYAQGYVFAHPMAAAQLEAMARAGLPRLPH